MVSDEALKKLQEPIAAWPMTQRFVVQQLIEDYRVMRDAEQVGVARLRELAEADKDGRVVVLPCKPGDTVYSIFGAEVIEKTVGRVIINGYTSPRIWVDLDCSFLSSVTKRWDLGIGKDFFLTREEAEKALEARK